MRKLLTLLSEAIKNNRLRMWAILPLLLLASAAHATPRWVKKTVEIAVYAAPVVTSLLATHEGHLCRQRNGVEPCTAHYGEFAGTEVARFGVSLTFSGLSMWGHKQGFKEWFVPATGISAFNSYWALRESRIHTEREK